VADLISLSYPLVGSVKFGQAVNAQIDFAVRSTQ
jgi:hypothetical protein